MKKFLKILTLVLSIGFLNSCTIFYTQDYEDKGLSEKINGTDQFLSAEYGLKLIQQPTNTDPVVKVQITSEETYQYKVKYNNTLFLKKNSFAKLLNVAGGLSLVGGAIANNTDKTGGDILLLAGAGVFGVTTLMPNSKYIKRKSSGGTKTYKKDGTVPQGLAITVNQDGQRKTVRTNSSGIIQFNVVTDFGLENFSKEETVKFSFYKGEQLLKESGYNTYISLKSSQWTNHNIRVVAQNSEITNANGYVAKRPVVGMVYAVKEYNYYKNAYKIDLPNNTWGYIKTSMVESFYTYGEAKQMSVKQSVKQYVEVKIKDWQKKDEFESSAQYAERLRKRDDKIREYTNEALWALQQEYKNSINWRNAFVNGMYDADREVFKVTIPDYGDIIVKVPLANAPYFKTNFNQYKLMNPEFQLNNGKWELKKLDLSNYMSESYVYQQNDIKYDPVTEFDINVSDDVNVVIDDNPDNPNNNGFNVKDDYDIEFNLPQAGKVKEDAWAVVIGNTKYEHTGQVKYAVNDAYLMKKYLEQVMGFKHVMLLENAGKIDMIEWFGNEEEDGQIHKYVKKEDSELFVFYSGHGAPGTENQDKGKGYLVPVDAKPNKLRLMGYSLELFYKQIAKIPAKKKTIVIDACFSGEGVIQNVSALGIKPKEEQVNMSNSVVITSSTGEQFSNWYNEKKHGLFTFYFLKAIHNKQASDKNRDNQLTYQEIFDYVSSTDEGVPYWSDILHNRSQNPTIKGDIKDEVFVDFRDF